MKTPQVQSASLLLMALTILALLQTALPYRPRFRSAQYSQLRKTLRKGISMKISTGSVPTMFGATVIRFGIGLCCTCEVYWKILSAITHCVKTTLFRAIFSLRANWISEHTTTAIHSAFPLFQEAFYREYLNYGTWNPAYGFVWKYKIVA